MFFITILLLYIKIPNPGSRTQDLFSLRGGTILLLPFYVCVCVCVYAMHCKRQAFFEILTMLKMTKVIDAH